MLTLFQPNPSTKQIFTSEKIINLMGSIANGTIKEADLSAKNISLYITCLNNCYRIICFSRAKHNYISSLENIVRFCNANGNDAINAMTARFQELLNTAREQTQQVNDKSFCPMDIDGALTSRNSPNISP